MESLVHHVQRTRSNLKDFQSHTVNYIVKQLTEHQRNKMLIADEVGLGKTIVSRGVIAEMFLKHREMHPRQEYHIIYICSNQAIAAQNISKLNFLDGPDGENVVENNVSDDRITALAYKPREVENPFKLRIRAFTPGTSFDQKSSTGRSDERLLLYRLLVKHQRLIPFQNSISWLMKSNRRMNDENWVKRVKEANAFDSGIQRSYTYSSRAIREEIVPIFLKELEKKRNMSVHTVLSELVNLESCKNWVDLISALCQTRITKINYKNKPWTSYVVKELRILLAKCCSEFLKADIFVLDEFQRYSKLLSIDEQEDNPGIELAREILHKPKSKVLMLSATPFKPFSNNFEEVEGSSHHSEFKQVLRFLRDDEREDFWKNYERDRRVFFDFMRQSGRKLLDLKNVEDVKNNLQNIYRACMTRTERLLVSDQNDAMVQTKIEQLETCPEDVEDFIKFDRVVAYLNQEHRVRLPSPLEYVKSCPFALSFLQNYAHKRKIEGLYWQDEELRRIIKKSRSGWLNLRSVDTYQPLFPLGRKEIPNAKVRMLFNHAFENDAWKLLWVPPSSSYYPGEGAFLNSHGFSKTLIFSAWKMVPKMIASITSYEAERKVINKAFSKNAPFGYFSKRRISPLLNFNEKKGKGLQGMNNFMLCYPSVFLADLYDPENNLIEQQTLDEIKKRLYGELKDRLEQIGIYELGEENGDWQKWTWYSILLLDKTYSHSSNIKAWLESDITETGADEGEPHNSKIGGKFKHLEAVRSYMNDIGDPPDLSNITEGQLINVVDHLAELCLGSPAICALRAFKKLYPNEDIQGFENAYDVASGFISLFNKPESIAIVNVTTKNREYHKKVVEYCISGNLQSMLDEYFYLLKSSKSISDSSDLANSVAHIMAIKPSSVEVGTIKELENLNEKVNKDGSSQKRRLRCHYAMDFGDQKVSGAGNRQINLREAFNSPFRPFVLASTSIGQEGLDFHFYSKKIIHWNLPSNPVDFEQREGRIHRFKGHVIRLNVAEKYGKDLNPYPGLLWDYLFEEANGEKTKMINQNRFACDLVPSWHLDYNLGHKIERIIPLYPFSKDIDRYKHLMKVLAFYRLTFGQPRQEELVEALSSRAGDNFDPKLLESFMIELAPIKFE